MPPGWRVEVHDSLPSTSDHLTARARAGEPGMLAIRAARQTSGRGSRGRTWDTGEGNLALSVLLRPATKPAQVGQWAFAGSLALHAGLSAFAPGLTLKWPNDVLLSGRKVAGLLVEAEIAGPAVAWVVLGMGVNLRHAPAEAAGCLGPHDPGDVASALLASLSDTLAAWQDRGFAGLRDRWLACAHPPGTALRVRFGTTDVAGMFAGLAEDGALQLDTPAGLRRFSAGEVLLR